MILEAEGRIEEKGEGMRRSGVGKVNKQPLGRIFQVKIGCRGEAFS